MTLAGRIVVVSPHMDDAVFSLGATIARVTKSGHRVEALTVFGGDPASTVPANGWDRRGGFETQGEAAAARRSEDRDACGIVGAHPSVLTFSGGGYGRPTDEELVWRAVADAVAAADIVLIPGFPLTNDDHAWLHRLLVERRLPCERLGLYVEQPYRYMARTRRPKSEAASRSLGAIEWTTTAARVADLRTKRKAILAYRSQLPLLGLTAQRHRKLRLMLFHEALHRGELVAELPGSVAG
jgi:LmbE family N-acetylglucosaminyl deacetylase